MTTAAPHMNEILHRHFDQVLVLTVERFTDRQQEVTERLAGIDFSFFYGTDKLELTEAVIPQLYHYDKRHSLSVRQYFPPLNTGEIACSLSHRRIYENILEKGWQHVLIFEDDVVPDFAQVETLEKALNELPSDWDLVYLGYLKNETASPGRRIKNAWYRLQALLGFCNVPASYLHYWLPRPFSRHLLKAGFHDCTHAYAISRRGAEKLLAEQRPVIHRADNALSALVLKNELNAFITRPSLFHQQIFSDKGHRSHIRSQKP
jgi:glycosyl transferase family 25